MADYRDDSAGAYGTWSNPQDQSWLDWLKMKAADVQEGGRNVQNNLLSALSPYGNEGWQVPPAVHEPINAIQRLAQNSVLPDGRLGIPNPQNVENQNDVLTGLLSLYGGNAMNPGRLLEGAAAKAEVAPQRMYHGTGAADDFSMFRPSESGAFGPGVYLSNDAAHAGSYAGLDDGARVMPLDVSGPFASMDDYLSTLHANGRNPEAAQNALLEQGFTGVTGGIGGSDFSNVTNIFKPGSVRSATTGETLFSDTGHPSLFGDAFSGAQSDEDQRRQILNSLFTI